MCCRYRPSKARQRFDFHVVSHSNVQKEPTGLTEEQEGFANEEKSVTTEVIVSEVAKKSPQESAVTTEATVLEVAQEIALKCSEC